MFNISNYQSPVCTTVNMWTEGFLCASSDEVQAPTTEKFDQFTDFEW